jgi:hypothetical protein
MRRDFGSQDSSFLSDADYEVLQLAQRLVFTPLAVWKRQSVINISLPGIAINLLFTCMFFTFPCY